LFTLLTGVFLTIQMSGFGFAWLKVTVAAFLLMAPLGVASGRRIRNVQRLSANDKMTQSEILDLLRQSFLKISLTIRIAVFLGIVLLMTAKPGLTESLAIAGGSVVLGLASAFLIPADSPRYRPRGHTRRLSKAYLFSNQRRLLELQQHIDGSWQHHPCLELRCSCGSARLQILLKHQNATFPQ
jgi:hypothetical protein